MGKRIRVSNDGRRRDILLSDRWRICFPGTKIVHGPKDRE